MLFSDSVGGLDVDAVDDDDTGTAVKVDVVVGGFLVMSAVVTNASSIIATSALTFVLSFSIKHNIVFAASAFVNVIVSTGLLLSL